MRDGSLFSSTSWYEFSESIISDAREQASKLDKATFDSNGSEQIIEHIASRYRLEPLEIYEDQKQQEMTESTRVVDYGTDRVFGLSIYDEERIVKIPYFKIIITLPYSGSRSLWHVDPSTKQLNGAAADITSSSLVFSVEIEQSSATPEAAQKAINERISQIRTNMVHVNRDLSGFNERLVLAIESTTSKRFEQLNKLDEIKTALKIPLEMSNNPSPLNQVKINVQKISPLSSSKDDPGANISSEDYETIIETVRSMGASMESNRASEGRDEESLRDMLLVGLSASIKGGMAGGELFHKSGKTDIAIPFNNKATFVAECKLWKGESYINEGVTQLLSYTTWRDAKTMLIIFNKDNKDFSAIQSKINDIFTSRKDYVRSIAQRDGEWRFILTKADDSGRHIEVHVLMFDVPH